MSTLLSDFLRQLETHFKVTGVAVRRWHGGTRIGRNLIEVETRPAVTILYVKESNNSPGFWGLTANQIERLGNAGHRWFAVFLHQSPSAGYLLTGEEVFLRIANGQLTLSGDGDYKLNEGSDLVSAQSFESFKGFLASVF